MISPTGKGVRNDEWGSGEYGARRGKRRHNGIDYLCDEGQEIEAPFDMTIIRKAYPKADMVMEGIEWWTEESRGKMFYFKPFQSVIGIKVIEGQIIGVAQSVSKDYKLDKMKDHIHFQIDK